MDKLCLACNIKTDSIILKQSQMSGKFSNTGTTTFLGSTLIKDQQYIRQLVQNEVFLIFEDIKIELQAKIKSIDKNIIQIKSEVKKIYNQQKLAEFNQLVDKIQKIQAEMQVLKYHQQNSIKISRTKSLDKERKPIFKREDTQYDFSSVILGFENESQIKSQQKIPNSKPPLPKEPPKAKNLSQSSVSNEQKGQKRIFANRNPVLDSSSSIHRWLNENNNRESSCFGSIIRQQQIEQSVFI